MVVDLDARRKAVGDLLLFVHIAAVAAWIGAGITQLIVTPALQQTGGITAAAWMRQTVRLGRILLSPAAILVLISGVWMVVREDVYEFEQAFVVIGFIAVATGAFLGMRVYGPMGRDIADLHESGESAQAGEKHRRIATLGLAEIALLLFTVWAMVSRWGL
jgi:hypothetical protein